MGKKIISIVVGFSVEGFHNWPDAAIVDPSYEYLSNIHRHMFFVRAKKVVSHDDRAIEIIDFKRVMSDYLRAKYGQTCEFGSRSCEMIADELVKEFGLSYCSVLEDNENGAEITVV